MQTFHRSQLIWQWIDTRTRLARESTISCPQVSQAERLRVTAWAALLSYGRFRGGMLADEAVLGRLVDGVVPRHHRGESRREWRQEERRLTINFGGRLLGGPLAVLVAQAARAEVEGPKHEPLGRESILQWAHRLLAELDAVTACLTPVAPEEDRDHPAAQSA